jgi:hypothetical protein
MTGPAPTLCAAQTALTSIRMSYKSLFFVLTAIVLAGGILYYHLPLLLLWPVSALVVAALVIDAPIIDYEPPMDPDPAGWWFTWEDHYPVVESDEESLLVRLDRRVTVLAVDEDGNPIFTSAAPPPPVFLVRVATKPEGPLRAQQYWTRTTNTKDVIHTTSSNYELESASVTSSTFTINRTTIDELI